MARARRASEHSRRRWAEFFDGVDVLVCPVSPTAAFPHDQRPDPAWSIRTLLVDGAERPYREMLTWMAPASLNHLPAAVAPIGTTRDGLPVGIQVIAPYLHDRTAVKFVRCLEDLTGGFRRPPGSEQNRRTAIEAIGGPSDGGAQLVPFARQRPW
ncbi:hypothetical protein GS500_26625 [Rhodococcus hoagii]|nr:hypothetical protein [Prescottella equi]